MISAVFKFLIQHRSLSYKHSNNYLPHSFRCAKIFTNPITMNKSIPQTYSHCTLPVTCPARPHSLTRPMHAKSSVTRPRDQYWIKHLSLDGIPTAPRRLLFARKFLRRITPTNGRTPTSHHLLPTSVGKIPQPQSNSLTNYTASQPAIQQALCRRFGIAR